MGAMGNYGAAMDFLIHPSQSYATAPHIVWPCYGLYCAALNDRHKLPMWS